MIAKENNNMNTERIIEDLTDMLETDEVLSPDTELDTLDEWDSLAALSLMAYAKKEFDLNLTAAQIRDFKRVGDICDSLLA